MEQYNPDPNHPKVTHQESRPKKNDIVTAAILFVTVMTDSVVLTDLNDKEREAWELLKTAVEDPEGERLAEIMTNVPKLINHIVKLVRDDGIGYDARGPGIIVSIKPAPPKPRRKKASKKAT